MSMPAANGEPKSTASDSPAPLTIGKRKRVQSHDDNKSAQDDTPAVNTNAAEILPGLVEVLSKYANPLLSLLLLLLLTLLT